MIPPPVSEVGPEAGDLPAPATRRGGRGVEYGLSKNKGLRFGAGSVDEAWKVFGVVLSVGVDL